MWYWIVIGGLLWIIGFGYYLWNDMTRGVGRAFGWPSHRNPLPLVIWIIAAGCVIRGIVGFF